MQALGLVWRGVDAADVQETRRRIPAPSHPGSVLLFNDWKQRRASDGFVVHRDVPSRPLGSILRNLIVFEPIGEMHDFRVRLAGSAMIRRFDCDVTGLKLSELFDPTKFQARRAAMQDVLRSGTPEVMDVRLVSKDRTQLHFEVLSLPVESPDRTTAWLMSGLFYYDWTQ